MNILFIYYYYPENSNKTKAECVLDKRPHKDLSVRRDEICDASPSAVQTSLIFFPRRYLETFTPRLDFHFTIRVCVRAV